MPSTSPGLKIATLRGVPVYIGRSWPIIALVIVALFGPQVARLHPEWGAGAYLLAAAYAVLLLVSVLAHEAAHAVVGQACGYRVNRIVADLWGWDDGLGRGSLDSHVKSLRAKVGSHRIRTVHGVGYALDDGIDR